MAPKTERKQIAEREWIDASGAAVTDKMAATGVKYTLLSTGSSIVRQYKDAPEHERIAMYCFGCHTAIGNEVNSHKDWPDPVEAARERMDYLRETGEWREPTGRGGIRYNREALANAMHEVFGKPVEYFAERMEWRVQRATGHQVLEGKSVVDGKDVADKDTVLYGTRALDHPDVAAAYDRLVPKAQVAVPTAESF